MHMHSSYDHNVSKPFRQNKIAIPQFHGPIAQNERSRHTKNDHVPTGKGLFP